jgi:hypothetical protein
MEVGRHLAFMALRGRETESLQQQCPARECIQEDVGKSQGQSSGAVSLGNINWQVVLQIKEFLRLITPIRGRLPRTCPSTWLDLCQSRHSTRRHCILEQLPYAVQRKTSLPTLTSLTPNDGLRQRLRKRYFMAFSKGARGCTVSYWRRL